MPGSFTDFYESRILDSLFGGIPINVMPFLYVGYMVGVATETGPGAEPNGGGYARIAVPNNSTTFPVTSTMLKQNGTEIIFNEASSNHGIVQSIGIFDSPAGGNLLAYMPLDNPISVGVKDAMKIPVGGLKHEFQPLGGLSKYVKNAILNHLYGAVPFNIIPMLYAGYCTSAPTDIVSGTEPTTGGYTRSAVANNTAMFPGTTTGSKINYLDINFPEATAAQGAATHIVFFDAPSGGNYLANSVLTPPQAIGANTEPRIRAQTLTFNLD
jgi:hypothetical protein